MTNVPAVQLREIDKTFRGTHALKGVTLTIEQGEIHALLGANGAGKSTLMNVLAGVVIPERGTIEIEGELIEITDPGSAMKNGIALVHQELALLDTMSVAENLFATGYPTRAGLIDRRRMKQETILALEQVGAQFSPGDTVGALGAGDRQLLEIARALHQRSKVLLLDEPTSSLTSREKARLFDVLRGLAATGTSIVYVTHFLGEVAQVCDAATVMRGGEVVGSGSTNDLDEETIVSLMVGEAGAVPMTRGSRAQAVESGTPALRIVGLDSPTGLVDINITVHAGEVVGLWGLVGSGRTELARAIVGLDPIISGVIEMPANDDSDVLPGDAIGYVTEDRRGDGLFLESDVLFNASIRGLRAFGGLLTRIDTQEETSASKARLAELDVKYSELEQPVMTLSGGNQQKVVLARWFLQDPDVYVLDEPTRGLDVTTKAEILRLISELAAEGRAILLINSDLDELVDHCDRFVVMREGRVVAKLGSDASREQLMVAAAGGVNAGGSQ